MQINQRLERLKREAPEEIPLYMKAGNLLQKIDGLSISDDQVTLTAIVDTLNFRPLTSDGEELKRNIIKAAKLKARNGLSGDGLFLID